MKKLLLTFLTVLCAVGSWAQTYEYSHTPALNTESYFTATKGGSSVSTFEINVSLTKADATQMTVTKAVKMESTTSISFTNTNTATVYIGHYTRNEVTAKAPNNQFKFDETVYTATNSTSAGSYEIIEIADVEAGTHTITRNSKEMGIYYIKVVENGKPKLVGSWSKTSDELVKDEAAPALPTFSVTPAGATKGTDYSVAYSLKAGSTNGIITIDAANGITAISTATAGTATAVATITNLNTEEYDLSTASYEYKITVLAGARSSDATLSDLKVGGVTIPGFDSETTSYDYEVANDVYAVPEVTYTVNESHATASINVSGSIKGSTSVEVTAHDGTTKKTYTITFKYPDYTVPTGGVIYKISNEQAITGGQPINTGINGVSLTCGATEGENKWISGKAETDYLSPFEAYTAGNSSNPTLTNDIPTAGTFYKFDITKNGVLSIAVILNGSKTLTVIDGEKNSILSQSVGTKVYKVESFDVEAGKTYYVYATSTKLGLYGFVFTPEHETISIAANDYVTFCSNMDLDFTNVEGLTAYAATNCADNVVTLTPKNQGIDKGTGLVLKNTTNEAKTFSIPAAASTTTVSGNLLVGVTTATTVESTTGGEGTNYVLAGEGDAFGWYSIASTEANIPAGKAYLHVPSSGAAKKLAINFEDGTTTGISTISAAKTIANGAAYNLAGQRVNANVKGIVVVNGKKVLNK